MRKLIIEWTPGSIGSITKEAIRISGVAGYNVEFTFNGVTVTVDADCDVYAASEKGTRMRKE